MSEINKLVEHIKQATDFQTNKQILREKIKTDLHVAHNGGLFLVSVELIAFLSTWNVEELFVEDTYNNTIPVNRQEFLIKCQEHYHSVMNAWHIEYAELKRQRKV